jgi:VIT1/CCC1 family predicted Fe2+/Mn2+ transporter
MRTAVMRQAITTGVSFGLTSGVITTLGLIVGLHSGTHSTLAVTGGVLTIAVADALSDALGIHIAEESNRRRSPRQVWVATVATFVTKLLMALSFLAPLLVLELGTAIVASVAWGFAVLTLLSYRLARRQHTRPWKVIGEHLLIAAIVVAATHLLGDWVASAFTAN